MPDSDTAIDFSFPSSSPLIYRYHRCYSSTSITHTTHSHTSSSTHPHPHPHPPPPQMPLPLSAGHSPLYRVSAFKELGLTVDGLDGYEAPLDVHSTMSSPCTIPTISSPSTIPSTKNSTESSWARSRSSTTDKRRDGRRRWYSRALSYISSIRPRSRSASSYSTVPSVSALPTLTHVVLLVVLFVLILPGVQLWVPIGDLEGPRNGAAAVVVKARTQQRPEVEHDNRLQARDDSSTAACLRWSHQCEPCSGRRVMRESRD